MEGTSNANPEKLHDLGDNTSKMVKDTFVNPGTPAQPLVTKEQLTKSTIQGNGAQALRDGLIK